MTAASAPAPAASSKTMPADEGIGPTLAPSEGPPPAHSIRPSPLRPRHSPETKRRTLALAIAGSVLALALLAFWLWPRNESGRPGGKDGTGDPDSNFPNLDREITNSIDMKLILIKPGKFRRVATKLGKGKPAGEDVRGRDHAAVLPGRL